MSEDFVAVVTAESEAKAKFLETILKSHGIEVRLSLNTKVQVLSDTSRRPYDVLVPAGEAERALDIFQSGKTRAIDFRDEDSNLAILICPHCGKRIRITKALKNSVKRCPACLREL